VLVLLYHRVCWAKTDPQKLCVTPENFEEQMRWLSRTFEVQEFERCRVGRRAAIVVTFDDGYLDNWEVAKPILERHGVPATIFVATGYVGTSREFWWDELERVFLTGGDRPRMFSGCVAGKQLTLETSSPEGLMAAYNYALSLIKTLQVAEREAILDQMRVWAGTPATARESHQIMGREELRELARCSRIGLGGHTVEHQLLSSLSPDEQWRQIKGSCEQLSGIIGREVRTFSYPFGGRSDYNRWSVEVCKSLGLSRVAANFPGQLRRWTSHFEIPRMIVRDWNLEMFKEKIGKYMVL